MTDKTDNERIADLEKQNTKLSKDLENANERIADLEKQNTKLSKDLENANDRIEYLEKQNTKLSKDLENTNERIAELEKQNTKLSDDLKVANEQNAKLRADLNALRTKFFTMCQVRQNKSLINKELIATYHLILLRFAASTSASAPRC